MEARNRSLNDWFACIRTRQVALPRFQRLEAWTHRMVAELLDTVLRDLPAGALLVLEVGEEEPFVSRTMIGAPEHGGKIVEHLLDGQQRLTALWRSLTDDYSDRTYFVQMASDEQEDESSGPPRTVSQSRWRKNGKLFPLWADKPVEVWNRHLIPVRLLCPDPEGEKEFNEWAKSAAQDNTEELIRLISLGAGLRSRVAGFNLPFLSLPSKTPKETALDVFMKMNTLVQPLKPYDIVVAQVEAATGFSLHELESELRKEAPTLEIFADPSQVILNAGALLQDREPSRSAMLGRDFAEGLIDNWDKIVSGSQRAAGFLDEEHMFDSARIPSDAVIPLLVALWARAPDGLDGEGKARLLLQKFLWRAFLTDRYELATNGRTFADYKLLAPRLEDKDAGVPLIFNDERHPLPIAEHLLLAGWPKKRERLARAILLISLRQGGLDFADGSPATRDSLRPREYHHIFPIALLERAGEEQSRIYRALNCALVTWKTNLKISDKSPIEYLQQRINASGEEEIRRRLISHCIDYGAIKTGNYDEFLTSRAEMVLQEVRRLGS